MKNFRNFVTEASLGRVFQIVNDKKNSFSLITAFRDENDLKTNRQKNKELQKMIRQEGFGFIKIVGSFIENQGTPEEVKVKEESFFINGGERGSQLKGFIKKAIKKYNQDSAIFRDSGTKNGNAVFLEKNGKETTAGKLTVGKVGDFMSHITGKNKHATFVFESIELVPNWIEGLRLSKLED